MFLYRVGCGGQTLTTLFIFVLFLFFFASCMFKIILVSLSLFINKMYTPRTHLRKDALRPH